MTTLFSSTTEWFPRSTESSSERTTVPWATVALAPSRMRPSTRADSAITPGLGGSSAGAHALELRFQLIWSSSCLPLVGRHPRGLHVSMVINRVTKRFGEREVDVD